MDAKTFYGSAYTDERGLKGLDKAHRYLEMACKAEEGSSKQTMAFNAALKAEAEAFA